MSETKKPKTFQEIDAQLQSDLGKISGEIAEIESHLEIGQRMFDEAVAANMDEAVIGKYKKGLEELQKGLEMFLGIKAEIEQTIATLHDTVKKAEEHIK
ncbi:MAG TPA: hypothetical protein VF817_05265 [Patescibacteria group bacterium]